MTTFFFEDKNNKDFQEFSGKQYNPNYEYAGQVKKYDEDKSIIKIGNKLNVGDKLEIIIPNKIKVEEFTINKLWDVETDEEQKNLAKCYTLGEIKESFMFIKNRNFEDTFINLNRYSKFIDKEEIENIQKDVFNLKNIIKL